MASEVRKLEIDVHIKASAEQFFEVFCHKTHHLANACPEKVQSVAVHDGEWGSDGSIQLWNYVHDGKACVSKQRVEGIDKENKKITWKVLEGDLAEVYKSFRFIMHVEAEKEKEGSVVHWAIEYEKHKDHIPDPHSLFHLAIEVIKDVENHLVGQDKN